MIEMLARIAACLVIIVIPFAYLAFATGKAEGLIWLMFPVVLAAPALFMLAIVLAPVEAFAEARGSSKNGAAMVAGSVGAGSIWLLMVARTKRAQGKAMTSVLTDRIALRTTLAWMALGCLLALIWRASEWLATSFGWLANG